MDPRSSPPASRMQRLLSTLLALPLPGGGGRLPAADWQALDPRARALCKLAAPAGKAATYRRRTRHLCRIFNPRRTPGIHIQHTEIPAAGPGRRIPVRHYHPLHQSRDLPGILYMHMGGWVIGDLDTCDPFCSLLAARIPAHVLSIGYRLAPEHRYPAAFMDAFAGYEWLQEQAAALHIDATKLIIAGDSAGGCMALSTCHELHRRGRAQPKLQLAVYPATDIATMDERYADGGLPGRALMDWFGDHFLNGPHESLHPLASPLRGKTPHGLAPALIATAGCDPLTLQAQRYIRRLQNAATPVSHLHYPNLPHGFLALGGILPAAREAYTQIADTTRAALA